MNVDKTKIFISYISLKCTMYVCGRKEDFIVVVDLVCELEYMASLNKLLELLTQTLEYVVSINL